MDNPDLIPVQNSKVHTAETLITPKQDAAPVESFIFIILFVVVALLVITFASLTSPLLGEDKSTDKTTSTTQITRTE